MASGHSAKRFEENRGNCKLCHLNPFEFLDHTGAAWGECEGARFQSIIAPLDACVATRYSPLRITAQPVLLQYFRTVVDGSRNYRNVRRRGLGPAPNWVGPARGRRL